MKLLSDAEYELYKDGIDEAMRQVAEEEGIRLKAEERADEMERLLYQVVTTLPEHERERVFALEPSLAEMFG